MNPDVDAVEQFYAAINRNDMQAMPKHFDPQIVRIEFEGLPIGGIYRGIAEVEENIRKGRGTWAEGTCEPEKYLVNGEKIVVYVHARVRLKGATEWSGGRFADGFAFRNGRIVEFRSFAERVQALEWAHLQAQEPA